MIPVLVHLIHTVSKIDNLWSILKLPSHVPFLLAALPPRELVSHVGYFPAIKNRFNAPVFHFLTYETLLALHTPFLQTFNNHGSAFLVKFNDYLFYC